MAVPTAPSQVLLRWSGNAMVGRHKKALRKNEIEFAPSIDQVQFYDAPREFDEQATEFEAPPMSNSNHKKHPAARFTRRGKKYAWGPSYEDVRDQDHIRKRMRICLDELMPESALEAGAKLPMEIQEHRVGTKLERAEDLRPWLLPHLRSTSPPFTTDKLAPMLALPQTYVDIMMSPSMRHTLGDDSVEQGLQRTASDLLESERPLMQSLGRLRDTLRLLERDVPDNTDYPSKDDTKLVYAEVRVNSPIPQLPHVSDTDNLWRVTQELITATNSSPIITYGITPPTRFHDPPTKAQIDAMELTPVQRLFTHPLGITINAVPSEPDPDSRVPPRSTYYNIDLANQVTAVDDAMERIMELLADCNEYKQRLEEASDRIADVARARKRVWGVIKERAGSELDRYSQRSEELAGAGQLL